MLRRSFLGAIAALPFVKFGDQIDVPKDPFIKINLDLSHTVSFKDHYFERKSPNWCLYQNKNSEYATLIPMSPKYSNKEEFLKATKHYKNVNLFEINTNEGIGNLFAIGDN